LRVGGLVVAPSPGDAHKRRCLEGRALC
jgi:hypothetical protein